MEKLAHILNRMIVVAVALLAVSIAMMNFDDLSWSENTKSYSGIIIAIAVLGAKLYIQKISKK